MDELISQVARQTAEKRYGKYRAFVTNNKDPEKRGRLLLKVPSVLGDDDSDWALPCLPFGGGAGYGLFLVPEIGAQVWMEFEEGDVQRPIWVGTFWQQGGDVPADASRDEPLTRLLQTPGGHILQFDDESGKEKFRLHHPSGAEVLIDQDGVIALTDATGATLTLNAKDGKILIEDANGNSLIMSGTGTTVEDANGNVIEMTPSGVTVKGQQVVIQGSQVMLGGAGGEPVIKGSSFLTLFATHVHPTAMGPSGPPIPQGEMSALSTKVLTA